MDERTLEIRWPWVEVPSIDGKTHPVNVTQIGAFARAQLAPDGGRSQVRIIGRRDIMIIVVGPVQIPVETDVGESLFRAVLERAEDPTRVPVVATAQPKRDDDAAALV